MTTTTQSFYGTKSVSLSAHNKIAESNSNSEVVYVLDYVNPNPSYVDDRIAAKDSLYRFKQNVSIPLIDEVFYQEKKSDPLVKRIVFYDPAFPNTIFWDEQDRGKGRNVSMEEVAAQPRFKEHNNVRFSQGILRLDATKDQAKIKILDLRNDNGSNPTRDENVRIRFRRLDRESIIKENNDTVTLRMKALQIIQLGVIIYQDEKGNLVNQSIPEVRLRAFAEEAYKITTSDIGMLRMQLSAYAQEDPKTFMANFDNESIIVRGVLRLAIQHGYLMLNGNTFIDPRTNAEITTAPLGEHDPVIFFANKIDQKVPAFVATYNHLRDLIGAAGNAAIAAAQKQDMPSVSDLEDLLKTLKGKKYLVSTKTGANPEYKFVDAEGEMLLEVKGKMGPTQALITNPALLEQMKILAMAETTDSVAKHT